MFLFVCGEKYFFVLYFLYSIQHQCLYGKHKWGTLLLNKHRFFEQKDAYLISN